MSCKITTKSGAEIASSHNGLLYALGALCLTKEEHEGWGGSNDLVLDKTQLDRGTHVCNFNFPVEGTRHVTAIVKDGRMDWLMEASSILGYVSGKNLKTIILS